jgi:Na+-driven multidrug efflux pump
VLNLGAVALYWYLGRLEHSAEAMAAYTICYTQVFSFVTWPSLGLRAASSALMGQNIGAGRSKRGKAAVHVAARLGAMWAIAWGLTVWFAAASILRAFGLEAADEADVVAFGTSFLRYYLSISGIFLAMALALTGGLVGGGETMKTMWIGMISQIGILLGLCQALLLAGLLSPQSIWLSILISHASRYVLTLIAFNRTEWKLQTRRLDEGAESA